MELLKHVAVVAGGGACGAVLRYMLSGAVEKAIRGSAFPGGTLTVNVLGCLLLGALLGVTEGRWQPTHAARLFLSVGVLGSMTTFSTFGVETLTLLRDGKPGLALLSVASNLLLGLGAATLGYYGAGGGAAEPPPS